MMRYAIRHETRFVYGAPVQFARCNLRLRPIDWPGQFVESFMLAVEPGGAVSPARRTSSLVNIDRLLMHQAVSDLSITASADIVVAMILPGDPDVAPRAGQQRRFPDRPGAIPLSIADDPA